MDLRTDVAGIEAIGGALDDCGAVGDAFRERVTRGVLSGVVLRQARDPIHVHGAPGTGKSLVADVVHTVASSALGRAGARVDIDCSAVVPGQLPGALVDAASDAAGGTLVVDRMELLSADGLARVERLQRGAPDVLLVGLTETPTGLTGARMKLTPLHERERDIWSLVDHYFERTAAELPAHDCLGFSRQSKADIAARVQGASVASVAVLRDIVRDCIYQAAADGPLPERLTSEGVRVVLEARYGQVAQTRTDRDVALLESAFAAFEPPRMADRLAEVHGIPAEVLERQAEILRVAIDTLDGLPKSYRNIMDRVDDVQRASLWLLSEAETQAEFRRFFGSERFMQPTKSVAWAFFNRVFKRDMG